MPTITLADLESLIREAEDIGDCDSLRSLKVINRMVAMLKWFIEQYLNVDIVWETICDDNGNILDIVTNAPALDPPDPSDDAPNEY